MALNLCLYGISTILSLYYSWCIQNYTNSMTNSLTFFVSFHYLEKDILIALDLISLRVLYLFFFIFLCGISFEYQSLGPQPRMSLSFVSFSENGGCCTGLWKQCRSFGSKGMTVYTDAQSGDTGWNGLKAQLQQSQGSLKKGKNYLVRPFFKN